MMFDPNHWSAQEFLDEVGIVTGQRRSVRITVPEKVVVAITSIYWLNTDSAQHEIELQLTPGSTTVPAMFTDLRIDPSEARLLVPQPDTANLLARFEVPLLLVGPTLLTVADRTALVGAGATMSIHLAWLQSKFDIRTSQPVVPIGTTT